MKEKKMRMVILTHNRIDHLKRTLLDWSGVKDIFIVDNGSTDGTQEFLSSSGYDHLLLPKNIGISGAEMAVVKKLSEVDWFMFVDDDISPVTPNVFKELMAICFKMGSTYSISPSIDIDKNYYPAVLRTKSLEEGELEFVSHTGGVITLHRKACDSILHIKKNIERFSKWRGMGNKVCYAKWIKVTHRGEADGVSQRGMEYNF